MPADLILFAVLAALLVFMFWNSRKRMQKMKAEQEAKRKQTVPGAKVLLQGGLYGTIVSIDAEDLDRPVEVELAPGVVVEVHSQAVIRVVDEDAEGVTEEEYLEAEEDQAEVDELERAFLADDHEKPAETVRESETATDAAADAAADAADVAADAADKDKPQA